MSKLSADVKKALTSVSRDWKKEKRKANSRDRLSRGSLSRMRNWRPPKMTIKRAAFQVMDEAIAKASSNGKYMANARQIMYAARPLVLKLTGGECWKNSSYFTQTILKDWIEMQGDSGRIVWDARGTFTEPHTDKRVPLGGASVGNYVGEWKDGFEVYDLEMSDSAVKTTGPVNRFGAVLFLEKEGFNEIFEDYGLAEKYDIAIMSTKGVPVKAACDLVGRLGVKAFVLRDFDLAGFKIARTLKRGTRLSSGNNDVIDLGFRLNDVKGLPSEFVKYAQTKDPRDYLRSCGASEEECQFLVREGSRFSGWTGERVELNAMMSEELIHFIEDGLERRGVKKVIPDDKVLAKAYERAVFLNRIEERVDEIREEIEEKKVSIPESLREEIENRLTDNREESWDKVVYKIASENGGDE